jgi:hypothetical protein
VGGRRSVVRVAEPPGRHPVATVILDLPVSKEWEVIRSPGHPRR